MSEEERSGAGRAEETGGGEAAGPAFVRQPWILVSCVLLVVSAFLLWRGRMEATFVVATLGVLAWFLNVRANLPPREEDTED